MTTCDCDETSCKDGCTKTHTHKTYSCDACKPKSPSITETVSELDGLREKATQGEWYFETTRYVDILGIENTRRKHNFLNVGSEMYERNNDYIVALHNAYPALRRAAMAGAELEAALYRLPSANLDAFQNVTCHTSIDINECLIAYRSAIEEKNV